MHKLNTQILLASIVGLGFGAVLQWVPDASVFKSSSLYLANLVGTLFIDLLKMILVPLVFCSICVGVTNLQTHGQAKRIWVLTLLCFATSMALAMALALAASNWLKPGAGLALSMFTDAMQNFQRKSMEPGDFFLQVLHGLFVNPFSALASGNVLAILIFALLFGAGIVASGQSSRQLADVLRDILAVVMRLLNWIMRIAPLGIAALLTKLVATQNQALLTTLLAFILLIIATTLIHGALVLPGILWGVTGYSPLKFWRGARPALITAFATSSSNATIPVSLQCTHEHLGVDKNLSGFVIPLGATINMDGTALYEAAAALFVANLAGVELSGAQQWVVFCTAMIASIGAPGIPSAGMVTMVMVLESVGLPAEAIAILLPIDRLLDSFRTAANVEGDMITSILVQHFLGDGVNSRSN